ncbi:adenosine deaminase [Isoptericola sp. b490]|uniref:adenosine deaminase n=1 Tax=Actinotalea lenta TaxID=3064654 RepID=UPI0027128690|nr:adenosine deaminase [Isoptericola sp. b490]MDO8121542.1 adenosine deaminase [Isoptericola sp. b490]
MSGRPAADSWPAMPKVELHCHLEGSVRPATFLDLARSRVQLPTEDPAHVYDYTDMASFMVVFERLCASVATAEDVARITQEALEDAAASGVVYREMFCNPTLHPLPYQDFLAGATEGITRARDATGIVARLIPAIFRGQAPEVATELARAVAAGPRDVVVGLGMDGDELLGPPEEFADAYAVARDGGLACTAHAGERFSPHEVQVCLDLLGCTRIDHGYGIVEDPELTARARDAGTLFTYAWLSTTYNYRGPLHRHPFLRMRDAGLRMSLGSDDPAMGGTSLAGDYRSVARALGFTAEDFIRQNLDALESSWLDGPDREAVRSRLWPGTTTPEGA